MKTCNLRAVKSFITLAPGGNNWHLILTNYNTPSQEISQPYLVGAGDLLVMFTSVIHELGFAYSWITLNKDPTVWLHGVSPANTFMPPTLRWTVPAQCNAYSPLKGLSTNQSKHSLCSNPQPGSTNWRRRLSTVDLLIIVTCFVTNVINTFDIKWADLN